jgi:hypothetical protein
MVTRCNKLPIVLSVRAQLTSLVFDVSYYVAFKCDVSQFITPCKYRDIRESGKNIG